MTAGRNWHGAYLAVLTVVFALEAWLSGSQQQVIAATFPGLARNLWYGGLIAGAVLVLIGVTLHTVTGLLIERAALFLLAGLWAAPMVWRFSPQRHAPGLTRGIWCTRWYSCLPSPR